MPHSTAWRHIKLRGGYLLDYAVHNADLFLYFMGKVDRVYAETQLWEEARANTPIPTSPEMARYYRHRVREDIESAEAVETKSEDMAPVQFGSGGEMARYHRHRVRGDIDGAAAIETTSEDMALALVRFESGAMGQFAMTIAAPGESTRADIVYCDDGSVNLPGSRSGRPVSVTRLGEQAPLSETDTLGLAPGFALDDLTAPFFNGLRRPSSYEMTFPEIDRKLIAIELQDFAKSILDGRAPEVTGASGLEAVAIVYAILESGLLHEPVSFADVVQDRVNAYQREINESVGL